MGIRPECHEQQLELAVRLGYLNAEAELITQAQRVGMLVRLLRKSVNAKVMEG